MAFVVRTKDNPGDVGRSADQQQSIDNEAALYAAVLGPGPVATGGMVKQFVKKIAIADNTATEFCTVTTTNEAGNTDCGAYAFYFEGLVAHGPLVAAETKLATKAFSAAFTRAIDAAGVGALSAVTEDVETASAAPDAATKELTTVTMTVAETTEYITSVRILLDLTGTGVETGEIFGMVTLYYSGFLTPPVVTSAG